MALQATLAQTQAADPTVSVWVSASAGSGKTTVLTNRVLRLLLAGTPPEKILCITYTKSGAAVIRARIDKRLGEWVMMEEDALRASLVHLIHGKTQLPEEAEALHAIPLARLMETARQLFARVIEAPVGLRVQTIHAFCQSLLARFPVEAGVPPHFTLAEGLEVHRLQQEAKSILASSDRLDDDSELARAVLQLARRGGEWSFDEMLRKIIEKRKDFLRLWAHRSQEQARREVWRFCGFDAPVTESEILAEMPGLEALRQTLRLLAERCRTGQAYAQKLCSGIDTFLVSETPQASDWLRLSGAFVHGTGEPKERVITQALENAFPGTTEQYKGIARHLHMIAQRFHALATAERTTSILVLAEHLFATYAELKRARAVLDYEDLIERTEALLKGDRALGWVMYKLDGGIDHILLDEAQDTSAAQWEITKALTEEFFAGAGARAVTRTLFVVGDEKQSIYSFQGAAPELFEAMRVLFRQKAAEAELAFSDIPLSTSFRSSPAILHFVDAVFDSETARQGLGQTYPPHRAHKVDLPGRVEIWPLFNGDQAEKRSGWQIPEVGSTSRSAHAKLADAIAQTIAGWLQQGKVMHGKPLRPGDILVLSRRRDPIRTLITAFRAHGVPCSGLDRMELSEHIAIQDMLALAAVLLLPEDDLALAALLKSPLYGLREEQLMQLCLGRGAESIWHRLQARGAEPDYRLAAEELKYLLARVDYLPPYGVFAEILYARDGMRRMCARLGEDAREVLEIFLQMAHDYEHAALAPSLQEFCQQFVESGWEHKREQEHASNAVRLMTAHAAKGLEARIVFLLDTTGASASLDTLQFHTLGGQWQMLALPPKTSGFPQSEMMRAAAEAARGEEYRRLLYVALTRAEEELYICGVSPQKSKERPDCWYALAQQGMERLPQAAQVVRILSGKEETIWRYAVGSVREETGQRPEPDAPLLPLPSYFRERAPQEEARTIFNPSHLDEVAGASVPLRQSGEGDARQRGVIIHRLLELLLMLPPSERQAYMPALVEREAASLAASERQALSRRLISLLSTPEWAPWFAEGESEVPIAGLLPDGRYISGQIDRLVVQKEEVWLLDFKTGSRKAGHLPLSHRRQMQSYVQLIQAIYPEKKVKAALLYTETAELVWL